MRKLFSRQLIRGPSRDAGASTGRRSALHDAVKAYVTDDRKLATKTKALAFD